MSEGILGNTILVEYGIQNEGSDLRAHVCPLAQHVYVYPTCYGIDAIDSGKFRKVPGFQQVNGYKLNTAEGYLVPPERIYGCIKVRIPPKLMRRLNITEEDSLSARGEKAVGIVQQLLKWGWFPLPTDSHAIHDAEMQISGMDIIVSMNMRIQVKCDFKGGERKHNDQCTGNLFLQVSECNPLRKV